MLGDGDGHRQGDGVGYRHCDGDGYQVTGTVQGVAVGVTVTGTVGETVLVVGDRYRQGRVTVWGVGRR